jgi:SAM-dependent methyltransferase
MFQELPAKAASGERPTAVRLSPAALRPAETVGQVCWSAARKKAKAVLPVAARQWLRSLRPERPAVGHVRMGHLRRVTPISAQYGFDRGLPVDRYYIANFLLRQSADVRGRVLEVGDNSYTRAYGGDRVTVSDVLHVKPGNPEATIIADLTDADHIPSDTFDCIILTQTLHLIYEVRAALATLQRILKPGGVLLLTVPGISQIAGDEWGRTWYWSFTALSLERLFGEFFPAQNVSIEAHGNVLAATAFLQGLATEELTRAELDYQDPLYQVLLTVRAVKPAAR